MRFILTMVVLAIFALVAGSLYMGTIIDKQAKIEYPVGESIPVSLGDEHKAQLEVISANASWFLSPHVYIEGVLIINLSSNTLPLGDIRVTDGWNKEYVYVEITRIRAP